MENFSDEQLIGAYLAGKEEALNMLIERYFKRVYNFSARFIGNPKEAEDVTQEVFLRVWRNLKKIDRKRPFRFWLWRVVKNACVDYLRRKKITVFSSLENDEDGENFSDSLIDPAESVVEKISRRELAEEMASYLAGLPEASRTIILLRYGEGLSFSEIADLTEEPLNTVKSRHRRALITLRKIMAGKRTQTSPSAVFNQHETE